MATEPFLINPPKKIGKYKRSRNPFYLSYVVGRQVVSKKRVKPVVAYKNPVGEMLVTIGGNPSRRNPMKKFNYNAWFGDSEGHRRAVMTRWKNRSGSKQRVVKPEVVRSYRRRRSIDRGTSAYKAMRASQLKEALRELEQEPGFVGFTTLGRYSMGKRQRVNRRKNTWFGEPRRHRRAAYKGWRRGHVIGGRRVRHFRKYLGNAPKYRQLSRRSYRRSNPALTIGKFTSGITNVGNWGPLAITGGLSAITGAVTPGMLGLVNPFARLGAQVAVAVGGSMLVDRFVGSKHGDAWLVVGVSMVGYQLLKQYVLVPYFPQYAVGLGAEYNDYTFRDGVSQEVGAFPGEISAFPGEMSDYPGVGAYEEEEDMVGAYPYGD